MMKRLFSVIFILISVVLGLSAQQKNILFIAIDDLKPVLSCYGESQIISPNIDKLASDGMLFKNAYCQWSVCGPSRASMLTGLSADGTSVKGFKMIREFNPDIITLPQFFKNRGYETAGVGKIFDPRTVDDGHDEISWTVDYTNTGSYTYPEEYGSFIKGQNRVTANTATEQGPEGVDFDGYVDGQICLDALSKLDILANNSQKPFFLAVGFKKPHIPFIAPKKYWDLYERANIDLAPFQDPAAGAPDHVYYKPEPNPDMYVDIPSDWDYMNVNDKLDNDNQRKLIHGYYACVSYVDDMVGMLLAEIEDRGLTDNTIIVLWGDHGYHLGDHNQWGKHTNFEQGVHLPLIIAVPNGEKGVTIQPVDSYDLYPTLVDLAGYEIPENLQGDLLTPILENKTISKTCAVAQFRSGGHMGYTFRTNRYRLTLWMNGTDDNPDKIEWDNNKIVETELYDYVKDPLESANLFGKSEYSQVHDSLLAIAENWWSEQYLFFASGRQNHKYVDSFNHVLLNPDFENGIDVSWEIETKGDFSAQFTNSTDSYNGTNSLAINVSNTGADFDDAIVKTPAYQCLSGIRDKRVSISAFAKSSISGNSIKFKLEIVHFNGESELFESTSLAVSTNYDSLGYVVDIPESAATWQLSILCGTTQGNINIDNVKLLIPENDYTSINTKYSDIPKLYPNPVNDILRIPDFFSDTSIITIYSLSGELLKTIQNNNSEVSFANFINGIYIVEIREDKNYFRQKIVVAK